ncbi:MAG: 4,5-DOPA dioxygenase extradiol [Clostridia bacterium]|nr:4,5-DOPA dioxygenase extradiol [Clostridia bacterium]
MQRMPVLFVGHGSPMNAIEQNPLTRKWREIGQHLPRPRAILAISAHWFAPGTWVNDEVQPRQIYDMYGFPRELYELKYPAQGAPELAARVQSQAPCTVDNNWGIDHGTWSVLVHVFPDADIPVCQLSIDRTATPEQHYKIGRQLAALRDEGVLILGSGNIVHNLRRVDFNSEGGEPWAYTFDQAVGDKIRQHDHVALLHPETFSPEAARLAIPTPDHYWPLLYVLGAARPDDTIESFNEICQYGSLSMTGYRFG